MKLLILGSLNSHAGKFAPFRELEEVYAGLSYKYFEMPFLRMKDKFSVVKSTNEM